MLNTTNIDQIFTSHHFVCVVFDFYFVRQALSDAEAKAVKNMKDERKKMILLYQNTFVYKFLHLCC